VARIRSIKPELRTSRTVARWPREVRYAFVLLWGYLDDHGYGVDDTDLIKADAFPLDADVTADVIDAWLDLMSARTPAGDPGPVCRFRIGRRRYVHCVSWTEHQRPSHPGVPKHPACPLDHTADDDESDIREDLARVSGSPRANSGDIREDSGGSPEDLTERPSGQVKTFARSSGDTPETLRKIPETLVPEQLAVSSEQGAAARAGARETQQPNIRDGDQNNGVIRTIMEACGATQSEARQLVDAIMKRDKPPANLAGFVRKLAAEGDLPHQLERLRADNRTKNGSGKHEYAPDGTDVCQHRNAGNRPCALPASHSTHRVLTAAQASAA
jgi:hypothetical protein